MALTIGTKLGSLEITALLGKGGMGEVYRARDTKLKRDVAIKTLPDEFARDADRLSRFQREAEVLASLNHPNIAAIYDLQEAGASRFLILELVEGETLAERISRGPIPIDEALHIAKSICEALEAAHEKGITHRDLKPANIKLNPEGKVKVLDFGLAKAFESAPSNPTLSNSPTLSMAATTAGVILGTAAYMSPEQARGDNTDARSDIFSFGCVLYEMLTGSHAFQGNTVSDILASVLKLEPDYTLLPQSLNPRLYEILRRCLEKNAKRRWHAAADLRIELEMIASDVYREPSSLQASALTRPSKLWLAITAVLLLTTVVLAGVVLSYRSPRNAAVMRFLIPSPDKTTFAANGENWASSISPDGGKIVFIARDETGKTMLWVRGLDTIAARPLQGTEGASLPFWSPDSKSIGFFAANKLKKIDIERGAPFTICDAPKGRGGTWNRDGVIVFAPNDPSTVLLRVSAAGGEPMPVTKPQGGPLAARYPSSFLPDGTHFLFGNYISRDNVETFVGSVQSLEARRLLSADSVAIYAPPGYLLFVRQDTLFAQPFDAKKLELTGEVSPIAEQVSSLRGAPAFSASENGTLAYVGESNLSRIPKYQLVLVDRSGKVIESIGMPALYLGPVLSPDGKRIAVHRHDGDGGDVWTLDTADGKTSRLTFDASQENSQPIWSADGSRIIFGSHRNGKWGIYQKLSNGTGMEELLFESEPIKMPMSWSAAANIVLFYMVESNKPTTGNDVWALPLTGDRKPFPVLQTPINETHPQISPDGKWFAYRSNETGRDEIYVQSFPPGQGKWQISSAGGINPRWRPDGKELFYIDSANFGKMVAVTVRSTSSTFEFSAPRPLFDSGFRFTSPGHVPHWTPFDVSSDGQRFLIPHDEGADATGAPTNTPITVVVNWTAALNKK